MQRDVFVVMNDGLGCVAMQARHTHSFADGKSSRHGGELNALVDELLVVMELLVGSTQH